MKPESSGCLPVELRWRTISSVNRIKSILSHSKVILPAPSETVGTEIGWPLRFTSLNLRTSSFDGRNLVNVDEIIEKNALLQDFFFSQRKITVFCSMIQYYVIRNE